VFGVGSVGSHVAKILGKTGFKNIELIDMDEVDSENISAQAFDFAHIGMPKVEAMTKILGDSCGLDYVDVINEEITPESNIIPLPDTIYCCFFDSFEARKLLFDKLKGFQVTFIDGRIGLFNMRHYLIDCGDTEEVKKYEATLSHGKSIELECGEKATAPINSILAGEIVMNIVNFIKGNDYVFSKIGSGEAPANDLIIVKKGKKVVEQPIKVKAKTDKTKEIDMEGELNAVLL